jgi:tRNA (guanine26-N2/guanine27-N2)-dimethyltransferase
MNICLPLAGTGVRGVRFFKELSSGKIKKITFNDISTNAVEIIKKNLKLNKINKSRYLVFNEDANKLFANNKGFDYIDIDPFGSPNPFLDLAIRALSREGILAVTATDTGALAGSFPSACKRKYWAVPKKDEHMHETGIRILIRKVQLIGAQYDKALIPIYSYASEHYYRIFFRCIKGKKKADKILKQHGCYNNAGPLWLGDLWDKDLAQKIAEKHDSRILRIIAEEAKIPVVGFHSIHHLCKRFKMKIPRTEDLIKLIKARKHKVAETHFNAVSLRTTMNEEEVVKISRSLF